MFDIGWSEMGVIALVTLVVMGPKELPNALRTFAYWIKKARGMAREFQTGVDQLIREAELDEAKKKLQSVSQNLNRELEKAIDPDRQLEKAIAPPAETKTTVLKAEAKPSDAKLGDAKPGDAKPSDTKPGLPTPEESAYGPAAAPPSAEVKPFPVAGVPLTGSAAVSASAAMRPNGHGAAAADGGVAVGVAKPTAVVPVNGADDGEDSPSRKAQSG